MYCASVLSHAFCHVAECITAVQTVLVLQSTANEVKAAPQEALLA